MVDSENKIIEVRMSEMKTAGIDQILHSGGIGSCIVITLYDPHKKIGAMAHPMIALPKGSDIKNLRFVECAIDTMINELIRQGATKSRLVAKIFGGAHMFKVFDSRTKTIGLRNVEAAKERLDQAGIPILSNDTGGNVGRSVSFDLSTGLVNVNTKI
jgi:chemotaxis protein CheD